MIAANKLNVASDAQINQQVGFSIAPPPKMCMSMRMSDVTRLVTSQAQICRIPVWYGLRFVGGAVYN